jgi:hypothetical protein
MAVNICNPIYTGGGGRRISNSRPTRAVSKTLSPKQNTNKRVGSMTQVVECLPEALGSISSTSINKQTNK